MTKTFHKPVFKIKTYQAYFYTFSTIFTNLRQNEDPPKSKYNFDQPTSRLCITYLEGLRGMKTPCNPNIEWRIRRRITDEAFNYKEQRIVLIQISFAKGTAPLFDQ